ncbi:hypothetical protein ACFVU0_15080 [Streptomyces sp. NPDC058122]|uniref:hypothetical protein n=1 Tax=Streptomyces sp. NPDC058122 TaxID=3346349 RepID=UPI0036F0DF8C
MKRMAGTLAAAVLTVGAVILPLAGSAAAAPGPRAPHGVAGSPLEARDRGGDHDGERNRGWDGDRDRRRGSNGDYDRDRGRGWNGDYDRDRGWSSDYDRDWGRFGDRDPGRRCHWSHHHGWGHHHHNRWVCTPNWLR